MDRGSEKTKPIQSQTKPILGKGKSKKAKAKNESKSGVSPAGLFEKTKPILERAKWR